MDHRLKLRQLLRL